MKAKTDWPVFAISGGILVLFVLASLIQADVVADIVDLLFGWSTTYFGAFWQVLMVAIFAVALGLMISKYGNIRLGLTDRPETSNFKWIAMIITTLMAGGGVFWAAAEPVYHFLETPPMYGDTPPAEEATIFPALAQSFLDWGFLAWAVNGTLAVVVLMYGQSKGMPLKPRILLYPIFGEKIMEKSTLGTLVDSFSIVAVAAGTIGPIGFLGLQVAYMMDELFGVPNTLVTQLVIVFGLVLIAAISAMTGVHKGIQFLSRFNIAFAIFLSVLILLIGPGKFIVDNFLGAFGVYVQDFLKLAFYRGDDGWLSQWTLFFWGWFIGYAPLMAIFISRISHGRTLRELFLAVLIISPLVMNFWFTIVGGTGIFHELQHPGSVSAPLDAGGLPAAINAIVTQLPGGFWLATGFLIVAIIFVATTADTLSYTISITITGRDNPQKGMRVFWAIIMGAMASILIMLGEGSIGALQSFIVVTAVPVSLILLPSLWLAPRVAKIMAREQGIIKKKTSS
ncbi:choline-glycine betaine transporter [Geomicrobium halophilum]|uniref:Choline-glycine betaine transporter n=1 Tax=Geomicrobium halophilum TaxID=549000 RepID=A0A841PWK0_9BACL|nr:BCCT family transporter [Geomicrobium halophilum]MBB6450851.1 choline-glycine betaine transporter [Geomicrobium halophilum]